MHNSSSSMQTKNMYFNRTPVKSALIHCRIRFGVYFLLSDAIQSFFFLLATVSEMFTVIDVVA